MNNISRFKFYGILTALILVVVGVVWFYPREHSSKVPSTKKVVAAKPTKSQVPKSAATPTGQNMPIVTFATPDDPVPAISFNNIPRVARPYTTPFDASMYLINLQNKLGFNPEQLAALQIEYSTVVGDRLRIEGELAQITPTGENSYKVVIPQYDADTTLRGKFYTILDEALASVDKSQLAKDIKQTLDIENFGWGITPQVMTINYNPDGDVYKIQHSETGDLSGGNRIVSQVSGNDPSLYYYIINKIKNIQNK